jgi:hypothetical protein
MKSAYETYRNRFPTLADAIEYEERVLSIGREFLPACAIAVLDGGKATAAYWRFLALDGGKVLASQHAETAQRETLDNDDHDRALCDCSDCDNERRARAHTDDNIGARVLALAATADAELTQAENRQRDRMLEALTARVATLEAAIAELRSDAIVPKLAAEVARLNSAAITIERAREYDRRKGAR